MLRPIVKSSKPRYLEFYYFDAGGGHRSAATALKQVIAERYPHWHVEMINLQELLQSADPLFRLAKVKSENVYNGLLKRGWTYGSATLLRGLQKGIRIQTPKIKALLQEHWRSSRPDLVVSIIPNFNKVIFQALRSVHPDLPYVTVMTDIADCPPHFWLERQDQYVICGNDKAVKQACAKGYKSNRIFQVSGMVLKPSFYRAVKINRRAERIRLGLDPNLPTALIMFGGNGSKESAKIVKRLERSKCNVQSIILCGHNKKLQKRLQRRKSCHAIGFTDRVPELMLLADFFIGKPGPGCISEALHCGLPIIADCNKRTMLQERYNTKWIEKNKLGIVVKSFRKTSSAVDKLLNDGMLETYRQNALRLRNRAVFEIPVIFECLMERTGVHSNISVIKPTANTPLERSASI